MIGTTGLSGDDNIVYAISFVCSNHPVASPLTVLNVLGPFGGISGEEFSFTCPGDEYVLNLSGRHGDLVDSMSVTCSGGRFFTTGGFGGGTLNSPDCPAGFTGAYVAADGDGVYQLNPACNGSYSEAYMIAGSEPPCPIEAVCPPDMTLKGISGRSGRYLYSINLVCSDKPLAPPSFTSFISISLTVSPLFGNIVGGEWFTSTCPGGEFIINFSWWQENGLVRAINVTCSGGTSFTTGGAVDSEVVFSSCAAALTGVEIEYGEWCAPGAIWRWWDSTPVRESGPFSPVFTNASACPSDQFPPVYPDYAFNCSGDMRFVGVNGYSDQFLYIVSFTCGMVPSLNVTTTRARRGTLGMYPSYDLVEPHPCCYYNLGPQYCPPPFLGLVRSCLKATHNYAIMLKALLCLARLAKRMHTPSSDYFSEPLFLR